MCIRDRATYRPTVLRYEATAWVSPGSGGGRSSIFFVIDLTASAAMRADAGSYTPQGASQCASATGSSLSPNSFERVFSFI